MLLNSKMQLIIHKCTQRMLGQTSPKRGCLVSSVGNSILLKSKKINETIRLHSRTSDMHLPKPKAYATAALLTCASKCVQKDVKSSISRKKSRSSPWHCHSDGTDLPIVCESRRRRKLITKDRRGKLAVATAHNGRILHPEQASAELARSLVAVIRGLGGTSEIDWDT